MMRGTYFRAWDTYNQAWADEYLAITEDGYVVIGNIHENPELIGKEKE